MDFLRKMVTWFKGLPDKIPPWLKKEIKLAAHVFVAAFFAQIPLLSPASPNYSRDTFKAAFIAAVIAALRAILLPLGTEEK